MVDRTSRVAPEDIPAHIRAEDRSDLPIDRQKLLATLRDLAPQIKERGVITLHLFGSYARGDANAYSDLDVVVDAQPTFTLNDLLAVQHLIEQRLNLATDVVDRRRLTQMKEAVEADELLVF